MKPTHAQPLNRLVRRLIARFHPEQIILFGSRARGNARVDSDVDLLVVMPVHGSKRRQRLALRQAVHDIPLAKDILVISRNEMEAQQHVVGTISRTAAHEGRVLYARPA